ncbi:MAG TPA: mersacidin/lichenicidin family type 2 lantibiotic [Thermoanaerobaculia bacterium]
MKKNIDLARAWRDQDYYLSLTEEERASLGAHPAGMLALEDAALQSITGGCGSMGYECGHEETVSVCPPLYCT